MAADQVRANLVRADELKWPPVLESAAEPHRALAELRAEYAARDREVRMRIHVEDATVSIDLPHNADMAVDVIDKRAWPD